MFARPGRKVAPWIRRSFSSAPDHDGDIPSAVADDRTREASGRPFAPPGASGLFELLQPTSLHAINDVARELDILHGPLLVMPPEPVQPSAAGMACRPADFEARHRVRQALQECH